MSIMMLQYTVQVCSKLQPLVLKQGSDWQTEKQWQILILVGLLTFEKTQVDIWDMLYVWASGLCSL